MKAKLKETELSDSEFHYILTEQFGEVDICGLKYSAGYALFLIDEIAFNEARNNYTDALDRDNPVYVCDECNEEFDNEEDAETCCNEDAESEG